MPIVKISKAAIAAIRHAVRIFIHFPVS